jgi:hypothetical protein
MRARNKSLPKVITMPVQHLSDREQLRRCDIRSYRTNVSPYWRLRRSWLLYGAQFAVTANVDCVSCHAGAF